MRLLGEGASLTLDRGVIKDHFYRVEARRGYDSQGVLWSPGYFSGSLRPDSDVTLIASTEPWATIYALSPHEALPAEIERRERLLSTAMAPAQTGFGAEMALASDQFIVIPAGRVEEAARARASGDEVRTVIAGYHWFTDWGRDTMIGLEGLTLATGRLAEAGWILRTFAHHVRDGLIPNLFPEGEREGRYHTADATLWFFHALDRYFQATSDRETLRLILPTLRDIVSHHINGTRFGIGVDPRDGLLRQGAAGYQLTWMDAKVGDWVVTPRRGKSVEINALWHNALKLLESWLVRDGRGLLAEGIAREARLCCESFNTRFWNPDRQYLYDIVDGEHGDDDACRPNQVIAIAVPFSPLEKEKWELVLKAVADELLTPVGLRTLSPRDPDYKPRYFGDLRARDAAYHQGTVWPWLIGPFVDAWLLTRPQDIEGARELLVPLLHHVTGAACVGSISEIFDAQPPYTPRGCFAQAWSVAELARALARLAESQMKMETGRAVRKAV
jgi:predicted glycogen debranching enzyme